MKVILHLGFPKTMSSTLQFGVFHPLHQQGLLNLRTWRQIEPNEHLDCRPSSRLFNGEAILDSSLEFKSDVVNVLSDESFTAPIKLRRNNYGDGIEDPFSFPEKIKNQVLRKYGKTVEFIPFIIIRNHADLIYSQYVEEYNLKKYKGIDLLFDERGALDMKGFDIYHFHRYLEVLDSVFGKGRTHLFLFEQWQENPGRCCAKLADIIGVKASVVEELMLSSHINKKEKSREGYYTKDGSVLVPFLTPEQKHQIRSFFEADTLKLQKLLGNKADLTQLGYL